MEDPVASSIWGSLNSWFTSTVFFILLNLMIATIVFTSNLPNINNHQQNHHHQQQQQEEEEEKQPQNTHDDHNNNQPQIARSPSLLNRLKSFNFHPQRPLQEYSNDHHEEQPLQLAASEYVFNQPLHYQRFDFDPSTSDQLSVSAPHFSSHNQTNQENIGSDQPLHYQHFEFDTSISDQLTVSAPQFSFLSQTNEADISRIHSDPNNQDSGYDEDADEVQSLDEVYTKLKEGHVDRTKSDGDLPPKPPAKMKKSASLKVGFSPKDEIVEACRPATVRERKPAVRVQDDVDVEVDTKADDFINKFKNDLKLQRIESIIRTKGAATRGTAK